MNKQEFYNLLACPVCKSDIAFDEDKNILICESCKKYYEIIDDIPVMLPDSGKDLDFFR
ncbi:MAG: Trm112 family protein [Candidatus Delongbacteria bacterium]|nr:Trm112 family protein [Candidatus Delongbacteria bacterium]MBN2833939.1 Trm112 family protein [Candidatus Delongbacteria bacterium]